VFITDWKLAADFLSGRQTERLVSGADVSVFFFAFAVFSSTFVLCMNVEIS